MAANRNGWSSRSLSPQQDMDDRHPSPQGNAGPLTHSADEPLAKAAKQGMTCEETLIMGAGYMHLNQEETFVAGRSSYCPRSLMRVAS